jgi:hypothetical protein
MISHLVKLGLAVCISSMAASGWAATIEYKAHAICDKSAGFCADSQGVSVALTKMYLGDKAEAKLMATIKSVGINDFDATEFTMTGGLTCHTKEKLCWTTRLREKQDTKAMKTLFGN